MHKGIGSDFVQLGFVDTDVEQLSDGMRYTPMKYER